MEQKFWEVNAAQWAEILQSRAIASRKVTGHALLDELRAGGRAGEIRSVLDAGCGEGWLARALASEPWAAGADYLGIDASEPLLDLARSKFAPPPGGMKAVFERVPFSQISRGEWKAKETFDRIVFNFALLDENITVLLREVAKTLRPGGRILIQTLHPCFQKLEYRTGPQVEKFEGLPAEFEGSMSWYHRTLEDWLQVLTASGLRLVSLKEPLLSGVPASIILVLEPIT